MLKWVLLRVGGTGRTSDQEETKRCVGLLGGAQREALVKKSIKKKRERKKNTSESMVEIREGAEPVSASGRGEGGGGVWRQCGGHSSSELLLSRE